MRTHRLSALCLVAIVVLLPLAACGQASSPGSAADGFLALLKEGRHLEAQDRLSADYKKMVVSLAGGIKTERLKPHYRPDNIRAYEVVKVDASSESARAHVRITTKDGSTREDDIELVYENGKWLVANF